MLQDFIEILILSAVQGISEFLPISSSAHLILVSNLYDLQTSSLLIDISLHLGSLLAIVFFFRKSLFDLNHQVITLDGDNIRQGLCSDLSFSVQDRTENIRRISELAYLLAQSGLIVITAFISPIEKDRLTAKKIGHNFFHSIYIKANIETCIDRDPKGLYQKAQAGEIKNFTGIDSPYEIPKDANLIINTSNDSIEDSKSKLTQYILNHTKI